MEHLAIMTKGYIEKIRRFQTSDLLYISAGNKTVTAFVFTLKYSCAKILVKIKRQVGYVRR